MAAKKVRRTKRRSLSTGTLNRFTPKRTLRKWEQDYRGAWYYRTESLTICVHGHIDYPIGTLFVSVSPDIGLSRVELAWKASDIETAKEQALEVVLQYCRRLYDELVR